MLHIRAGAVAALLADHKDTRLSNVQQTESKATEKDQQPALSNTQLS